MAPHAYIITPVRSNAVTFTCALFSGAPTTSMEATIKIFLLAGGIGGSEGRIKSDDKLFLAF
jgi:hypothetical protein